MATKRVIKRRPPVADLAPMVAEYLLNRSMKERSTYHEGRIKAGLMNILAEVGDLQENDHRHIVLDEPQTFMEYKAGKPVEKTVTGIQRQFRKGRMALDEDKAMAYLKRNPELFTRCTMTQIVIDEDALLAANFSDEIPDDDFKEMYDEGEPTYAFYLEYE
jgi:hypothetical protein